MNRYQAIRAIADALATEGHETYLVGGAVRDALLDLPAKDLDLATSARPDDVVRLLTSTADDIFLAGKEFGIVGAKVHGEVYEVATFRGDKYDGETRKPVVEYADRIEDDLARRDFTINAMAKPVRDSDKHFGTLIDPFHGVRDLRNKVLRTPGKAYDSFRDDPLRMVRAARFIARFGLRTEMSLENAITGYPWDSHKTACAKELHRISAERIAEELVKLLLVEDPTAGLDFLARTGLSDVFLPELNAMKMEDEPGNYKDVYTHTLAVVRQTPINRLTRLAALFHDVAKPMTYAKEAGKVSFHYHEVKGEELTARRLRALKFDNDTVDAVSKLVRLHLRVHTAEDWTDRAVRRYIRDAGPLLQELNDLQRADCTTKKAGRKTYLMKKMDDLETRIAHIQEVEGREVIKPPLNGRQVMDYLGLEPGREVGEALAYLLEIRLDIGPMSERVWFRVLDDWAAARS